MRRMRALCLLCLALVLGGCAKIGVLAANAPASLASGMQVSRDIVFDGQNALALDIYAPAQTGAAPRPVVVFFYGGKWQGGSRKDYAFVGQALTERGYIVVIPDYRKYPAVKFPAFIDDGAKAVAWVYDHIARYGGDASRIAVAGHSAGAHTAALLATDASYMERQGKSRAIIKAFAGLAGPYAFTPHEPDLIEIFGPPERYPLIKVPRYVDGKQPPMLLMHGADDTLVGLFNLQELEAAIRHKGGRVETRVYPRIEHVWIVGALSWLGRSRAPVLEEMVRFLDDVL